MENEILTLIKDESIRNYLKSKFSPVYGEYESYIPEWVVKAVERYNPNKNTTLKTYVTLRLKYNFLTKIRLDKHHNMRGMMVYDYPIEHIPDTSIPINMDKVKKVERTFKKIVRDFIQSKRKRSTRRVDCYELIADYIGINRESLKPSEIVLKHNVSRQYLSQVYNQFINFIKSDEVLVEKIRNLYYN